jgi:hypothetical protein
VRTFKCPTFFAFHFGNAFESADGSMLHVDVAAYDDPTILNDLKLPPLVSPTPGHQVSKSSYRRLSIPLTPSSSSSGSSSNGFQEIAVGMPGQSEQAWSVMVQDSLKQGAVWPAITCQVLQRLS